MTFAMRPDHFFGSARFEDAVCGNHIMVAAAHPAERSVVAVDVRCPQGTARLVGRAVHDNQCDGSHKLLPSAPPAAPLMSNSMNLTT